MSEFIHLTRTIIYDTELNKQRCQLWNKTCTDTKARNDILNESFNQHFCSPVNRVRSILGVSVIESSAG
jgi:hypothetical protein